MGPPSKAIATAAAPTVTTAVLNTRSSVYSSQLRGAVVMVRRSDDSGQL
jgi:hypothetical protein